VEEIVPISARLIINQAALKLKREAIQPMLEAFSAAIIK
jgi:ATP phosphoribosyltransferase